MKSNLIFLLAFWCFTGCKKEEVSIFYPGEMTYGKMSGNKNGKDWVASSSAQFHDNNSSFFGIGASTFSKEGFLRESLVLNKIPLSTGYFKISGTTNNVFDGFVGAVYHTSEDDGDVSEDSYEVDENATNNFVEITLLDTIINKVEGNLEVSFKIATLGGKRNPNNPDKIKFSNCKFEVKFF